MFELMNAVLHEHLDLSHQQEKRAVVLLARENVKSTEGAVVSEGWPAQRWGETQFIIAKLFCQAKHTEETKL